MMKSKKFATAAVVTALLGWGGAASAAPITIALGSPYSLDFFLAGSGTSPQNDLTAHLDFHVVSLSATQIVADFTLTNTTVGIGTITNFGFSTNPDALSISGSTTGAGDITGDTDTMAYFKMGQLPSLTLIEVCGGISAGGSNCSGGAIWKGIGPGGTFDGFRITLKGTGFAEGTTTFDNFGVKFQGAPGSFEFYSAPPVSVPEPASILLLGTGLIGLGGTARRRLRKK